MVKELTNYDMKRIIGRAGQEFGKIERGTEEDYNPQLDYIEQRIYEVYRLIPISDYELQEVISVVIYDLKSHIENIKYDYSEVVDKKVARFARKLSMIYDPFINKDIKVSEAAKNDLKGLFTLPIICLCRIYDSIDFWHARYGIDGYFRMLEEYVVPRRMIGKFPYALEEKYLTEVC